tara:strand:+ start:204 stop:578 length:375 start_codon:yes stop_codon:yes gene_type:complete
MQNYLIENKKDDKGIISHKKRYPNIPVRKDQEAYGSTPTIYIDDEDKVSSSMELKSMRQGDDDLLSQTIYDMILKNSKRIKKLEDQYQTLSGNFKVITGNTKDNRKYIINLNKDIEGLVKLYNP